MRYDYHNYIGKIRNHSENVYRSYEIYSEKVSIKRRYISFYILQSKKFYLLLCIIVIIFNVSNIVLVIINIKNYEFSSYKFFFSNCKRDF